MRHSELQAELLSTVGLYGLSICLLIMSLMVSCRVRRDEANIMAWENLQKAKAEAEIRKLEVHAPLA